MKTLLLLPVLGIWMMLMPPPKAMASDGPSGFNCGDTDPIRGPVDSCDGRDPIYGGFVRLP